MTSRSRAVSLSSSSSEAATAPVYTDPLVHEVATAPDPVAMWRSLPLARKLDDSLRCAENDACRAALAARLRDALAQSSASSVSSSSRSPSS